MSTGRVPTEIFGVSEFFYRSFAKKNFRDRGPQKSMILGLFSKIDVRNFCQFGQNVFFVLPIFPKNRGNGGLFWGMRPDFFSQKLTNIAGFVCKNYSDRRGTRKVIGQPMTVFFLSQHGTAFHFTRECQ